MTFRKQTIVLYTLPETNIALENGWLEYDRFLLRWPIFRGGQTAVSFREWFGVYFINNSKGWWARVFDRRAWPDEFDDFQFSSCWGSGLCMQLLNGCEWIQCVLLIISMVITKIPIHQLGFHIRHLKGAMCGSFSICSGGGGMSLASVLAFFHWFCVPWSPPEKTWKPLMTTTFERVKVLIAHLKFDIAPENRPSQKKIQCPTIIFLGAILYIGGVTIYILTIQFYKPMDWANRCRITWCRRRKKTPSKQQVEILWIRWQVLRSWVA